MATKSYFVNESGIITRGMKPWNDLGYSLDIPWNDVVTAGWMDAKPTHSDGAVWGAENVLTTRRDPEFYAPDDIVRTTGDVPIINVSDPRYSFDRSQHAYKVY